MAEKPSLVHRLLNWGGTDEPQRSLPPWYQGSFTFNGIPYAYSSGSSTTIGNKQEEPAASFEGFTSWAYSNPVVFACMETRALLFSEARFQYRQLRSGRPGDLFGTADLAVLENPTPNETTGDLLKRAIQDVDLSGNYYATRIGNSIYRMRPDWVSIIIGSKTETKEPALAVDAEVAGYIYKPGGYSSREDAVILLPENVCHFAPIKAPGSRFTGISWLTTLVREVMADTAATDHKLSFFENGATVNAVVAAPEGMSKDLFDAYERAFRTSHEGRDNAYKALFIGGGMTYTPIGSNMQEVDFKLTQGAGETRIAAAARVPPIMVGLSEGLSAATYSNYGQARRAFADLTMRPLWRMMAGALETLVTVPGNAELWYDDRDIPFLQEDVQDEATIQSTQAATIRTLLDAGFTPETVTPAVTSGDWSLLVHSGLFSVQLQPPGTTTPDPAANGKPALPIGAP